MKRIHIMQSLHSTWTCTCIQETTEFKNRGKKNPSKSKSVIKAPLAKASRINNELEA